MVLLEIRSNKIEYQNKWWKCERLNFEVNEIG